MKLRYYMIWCNSDKTSTLAMATSLEPFCEDWSRASSADCAVAEQRELTNSEMARQEALIRPYNTYLALAMQWDFPGHDPDDVDIALEYVAKLERGEADDETYFYHAFIHSLSRTTVTFENAIFSECYEWPNWSCSLAEYKTALEAWRVFIAQPPYIDNEMIVELPDRPAHIAHNQIGPLFKGRHVLH